MRNLLYTGPSFEVLHNNFSKQRKIDDKAPVISKTQINVHAPIDDVWDVIYNIGEWQEFHPFIKNIRINSGVKPDAVFTFSLKNMPIKAKFAIVEAKKELSWTGKSMWTKAVDRITLKSINNFKTQLNIEESLSGFLIPLFVTEKQLAIQHQTWLNAIKKRAEKQYA